MPFGMQIQELFSKFDKNDFYLPGNWFKKSFTHYIKWKIKLKKLPFSDYIDLALKILRHMVRTAGL